jgi:hypothetical protein
MDGHANQTKERIPEPSPRNLAAHRPVMSPLVGEILLARM